MKTRPLSAYIATVLSTVLLTACVGTSATAPKATPVTAKPADLSEALAAMTWQLSSVGMVTLSSVTVIKHWCALRIRAYRY